MPRRTPHDRRALVGIVTVTVTVTVAVVSGCSSSPTVEAAPQAGSPACTAALAAAPALVLDQARTTISTAGALAWGDPAIVVRCGLEPLGPSTKSCIGVNGIDWVIDDASDPVTATSYGRAPAVEVRMPRAVGAVRLPAALVDLAPVATALPTTSRTCTGPT